MSRITTKDILALRQDQTQPFLFDNDSLPVRPDVVEMVRNEGYKHTGARLLDNEELTLRVVEMLVLGTGLKKIAKTLHISTHSIREARAILVHQGKLAPFKERVVQKIEDAIETGLDHYLDGVERGLVAPAQIPVGTGILWDKRALALGEATSILGAAPDPAMRRELSEDTLNAYVESLKSAHPNDSQSIVLPKEKP